MMTSRYIKRDKNVLYFPFGACFTMKEEWLKRLHVLFFLEVMFWTQLLGGGKVDCKASHTLGWYSNVPLGMRFPLHGILVKEKIYERAGCGLNQPCNCCGLCKFTIVRNVLILRTGICSGRPGNLEESGH